MIKEICAIFGVCALCFWAYNAGVTSVVPEIVVENECNLPKITSSGQQINGFYDPLSGYLMVYTGHLSPENAEYVLLHEFGHYKYYIETGEIIVTRESEAYAQTYAAEHVIKKVI